jgi:hypothetical protein
VTCKTGARCCSRRHSDVSDGWTRLFLVDGRVLMFADCEAFAIVFTKEILQ